MQTPKRKTQRVDLVPEVRGPLTALVHDLAPVAKRLGLRVFLVGGAVRDMVAGNTLSGDWDLVVFGGASGSGNTEANGALELARAVAKAWEWREPVSFPRFGTHLVVGKEGKVEFSQAQLRTKLLDLDPDPLVSDALSRDFTVNALYIELTGDLTINLAENLPREPVRQQVKTDRPSSDLLDQADLLDQIDVLDPTGYGIADLGARLLRTPLPARTTFTDDPLRIVRAARFKAVTGYKLHASIGKVAGAMIEELSGVAPERIREELDLILMSDKPSRGLEPLVRWGAFATIAPEIQAMSGFIQDTPWHYPDLLKHTLRVVDRCPTDLALRWAALLHDCGKPMTRVASEDGDSYYGHDAVGADLVSGVLKRFKCGRARTKEVSELVRLHMVHYQDEWSERAVGRFIRRAGTHLDKLLDLVAADSASLRLRRGKVQELEELRERVDAIRDNLPSPRSPLDGQEIMDLLELESGELVGRAKAALAEAVGEGHLSPDENAARAFLLDWYAQLEERRRR